MTDTLQHTVEIPESETRPRLAIDPAVLGTTALTASLTVAAALASLLVAVGAIVAGWALVPTDNSVTAPLHVACQLWLAAQHVAMDVPSGRYALAPLGFSILPAGALFWAGWYAGRTRQARRQAARSRAVLLLCALLPVAAVNALCGLLVATFASTSAVAPDASQAAAYPAVFAAVCFGAGLVRGNRLVALPGGWFADAVGQAAIAGVVALLGASALLCAIALASHLGTATAIAHTVANGTAPGVSLLFLDLVFLPNTIVWAISYATGPGFTIGVGSHVSLLTVRHGALPAVPLLAMMPGHAGGYRWLAVCVPLAAGVATGLVAHSRTRSRATGLPQLCAVVGAATMVAALLSWGLATLAGGSVTSGTLREVGPEGWQVGAAVMVELTLAAVLALFVGRGVDALRLHAATPGALDLTDEMTAGPLPLYEDTDSKPPTAEQVRDELADDEEPILDPDGYANRPPDEPDAEGELASRRVRFPDDHAEAETTAEAGAEAARDGTATDAGQDVTGPAADGDRRAGSDPGADAG